MVNQDYTPYGEEWKIEVKKLSKPALIDLAARIGKQKDKFAETASLRDKCRSYLMGVRPEDLTVEDCLTALGFTANGLSELSEQ